jgi:hypothetical protein
MQRYLLTALAVLCVCGAPALAGSFTATGQFAGTVGPQVTALLSQFPAGGPGLRAAIAQLVEKDPSLADDAVFAARNGSRGQKEAVGGALADAASFFAKCGAGCSDAEQRVRNAMAFADAGTRVGFVVASTPTLAQGIPGFNNAGVATSTTPDPPGSPSCISPSRPGC